MGYIDDRVTVKERNDHAPPLLGFSVDCTYAVLP